MLLKRLRRRWAAVTRPAALDAAMETELQLHLDLETDRLLRQGVAPEEARTAAFRSFGGVERIREECRDARGTSWADTLSRNARWAVRILVRQPGYTVAVIATLALGIGANTAVFSLVRGVLLKPLPYPESDRLVVLQQSALLAGHEGVGVSIRELYDYREQLQRDFRGLVEFHDMTFDLLEQGEPDRVATGVVSANFFDVIGIRPLVGRTFVAADEQHGAEAVLVLSHHYWQTRFNGDPGVVGRRFQMNDRVHTVVGVLPPVPAYPTECDLYMPTSACPFRARAEERTASSRRAFGALNVFGRLAPGVSIERANADVAMVASRFAREHPDVYPASQGFAAGVVGLLPELTKTARPMLAMLLGATLMVLVLACANIASMTLARTLRRDRELALRVALGAGRRQLVGQLLSESALLALLGGTLGLLMAAAVLGALTTFVGRFTPRTLDIAIDLPVLAFTLALSALTGITFGALPAWLAGSEPAASLKQAGPTAGGTPARRRLQHALVVAQVAVSVVLLVGAGLLLTSVYRLQQVDPGYRADRVLSAEVFGNFTRYREASDFIRFYTPLVSRLEQQPGVVSAAVASAVPLSAEPSLNPFRIEGVAGVAAERLPQADIMVASNGYFDTLRVPLRRGRMFRETDTREAAPVVVISERMAHYWTDRDPIGSRISLDDGETWLTVVGVVGNVRQFGLDRDPPAQAYLPLAQTPYGLAGRVLVRTTGEPLAVTRAVREAVRALDPNLPIKNVSTLEEQRSQHLATPRLTALLLTLFAAVALVVTLTGLAGLLAMSVSQRTREFGLRMALGATPVRLIAGVLSHGALLLIAGLVLGITAASATSRLLVAYLFDTRPTDPVTFGLVAAAFIVAGLAACLVPARRATQVDPMLALRSE
jgi:putative ABC transport system permease protein